ncbi:hypothetical protein K466DRAFT_106834 [Polyporus arcularius HHB13444]|uniref:Uncharacterized protein n=1 Tax=Polyporus arcularius HHB13444 TaxID=1314778 RepID=A0A5C3PG13_9APHY|nr:hypothetical protein K466DRAFT_106834 [Polyporus arcularius HHB13444]
MLTRRPDTCRRACRRGRARWGRRPLFSRARPMARGGMQRRPRESPAMPRMRICSAAHWASTHCLTSLHHRRSLAYLELRPPFATESGIADRCMCKNLEYGCLLSTSLDVLCGLGSPSLAWRRNPIAFGGANACLSAMGVDSEVDFHPWSRQCGECQLDGAARCTGSQVKGRAITMWSPFPLAGTDTWRQIRRFGSIARCTNLRRKDAA